MYEHRSDRLLPFRAFVGRFLGHAVIAAAVIAGSLLIGMLGYEHFEGQPAVDAFLNAAMLLGGMGPVAPLVTTSGKLFAGAYALYSGIVFLVSVGILLAPVLHRVLHRFHLEEGEDEGEGLHASRRHLEHPHE